VAGSIPAAATTRLQPAFERNTRATATLRETGIDEEKSKEITKDSPFKDPAMVG
jgi:hypothetical protein